MCVSVIRAFLLFSLSLFSLGLRVEAPVSCVCVFSYLLPYIVHVVI